VTGPGIDVVNVCRTHRFICPPFQSVCVANEYVTKWCRHMKYKLFLLNAW
jgi:hypothetical protein